MQETRICLVRHGETSWNTQRRWQGHVNIPLNTHGLRQARAVAKALENEAFSAIYHSDLQRAATTAQTIADTREAPMIAVPAFRERHFGAIQGLNREEAATRFPELYPRIQARETSLTPPGEGGESLDTFARRIGAALENVARLHAGERILIVSHGGCMDIMYRIATGMPLAAPRDFALGNATINWISWQEGQWQLHEWDKNTHLANVMDEISA